MVLRAGKQAFLDRGRVFRGILPSRPTRSRYNAQGHREDFLPMGKHVVLVEDREEHRRGEYDFYWVAKRLARPKRWPTGPYGCRGHPHAVPANLVMLDVNAAR